MTLDEILASMFPAGHDVSNAAGTLRGTATLPSGERVLVVGIADRTSLGIDEAAILSRHILDHFETTTGPIFVIVDSDSQRMSKRDELLGLNEFLSHLAKCLLYADMSGRPTIGLLYGHAAAGAFLATALATRVLVALPQADPAVMDLPSMSRVTKLPVAVLEDMARSTPVFAPGLGNLARTGAVERIWDADMPLSRQLEALLAGMPGAGDVRDVLGRDRGGRLKAAAIAGRVRDLALRAE
ncbi:biotin-independent malonate decarboxylase subunit gamma [Martelella soudanensis]|uniref:biotin-independent malonate decarboxylase subunit gamma n=1 Tax=unclassified Martelella TaxID=2629616 RepID=UPI0015DEF6F1|nr:MULTISPECIES: biotin-independent malonate decarboxylase subunit gamma [unclassified Martelella]